MPGIIALVMVTKSATSNPECRNPKYFLVWDEFYYLSCTYFIHHKDGKISGNY